MISTLYQSDSDYFWNFMIEKYYPLVLKAAYILTGDREMAMLRNPNRLGSWLITITINTARDSLNREKRAAVSTTVDSGGTLFGPFDSNENIPLEMAELREVSHL